MLQLDVVLRGLECSEKRLDATGIVIPSASVHVRRVLEKNRGFCIFARAKLVQ